eukprot:COSAG01_NODE_1417_length_10376_cov_8.765009_9_plen_70_part_00
MVAIGVRALLLQTLNTCARCDLMHRLHNDASPFLWCVGCVVHVACRLHWLPRSARLVAGWLAGGGGMTL